MRDERHQARTPLIMATLILAMLLAVLDHTIIATALPTIVEDLGGLTALSWVVTAYLLGVAISTLVYGKLGDQFGRKPVFVAAIVIFLLGAALSGTARSMGALIAFRALQGVGGGGLIVLAQAIVADVVSPRRRAKYQGYFGAMFGAAAIAGPLVGGFITDNLSWRWVFYVNVPLGLVALVMAVVFLPWTRAAVAPRIDYLGMALLGTAVTGVVLLATWGGTAFAWDSPTILALGVGVVVAVGLLLVVESRAAQPVLPLRLFRNRTFGVAAAVGLVMGIGMFSVISFLPLYLQVVGGASATDSGLQLTPMMLGLVVSSIVAGQVISRTGHYRSFPIAGTAIAAVGMWLLSTMDAQTSPATVMVNLVVLGTGLGLVLQVLILAVQSAVAPHDLGVATASANFFRSVGGSVGVATFGAVFNVRLVRELRGLLPRDVVDGVGAGEVDTAELLTTLPPELQADYVAVVASTLTGVFLLAALVTAVAFLVTWLLPSLELRSTTGAEDLAREMAATIHPGATAPSVAPRPTPGGAVTRDPTPVEVIPRDPAARGST